MVGQRIGKYSIVRKLGEGGMGAVYLAQHAQIGTRAAIKVLLPRHSHNRNVVRRFFNEARATAKIKHPGLVEVFDFGELEDGSSYLVMEWLEGETLGARISHRSLGPALTAEIGRQIALAVQAAHAHGIVHRDLKPENVFLVSDSDMPHGVRVKVLDFGVAKLRANGPIDRTASALLLGTPAYMAPEQCRGAASVDHRADIYAIGCVLFEMACGRCPFAYDNWADLITAHMTEQPPDPLAIVPSIPLDLRDTILRCLAKSPAARYAQSSDLADALLGLTGRRRRSRGRRGGGERVEPTRIDPELAGRIAMAVASDEESFAEEPTVPRSTVRIPKQSTLSGSASESLNRPTRGRSKLGSAALVVALAGAALLIGAIAGRVGHPVKASARTVAAAMPAAPNEVTRRATDPPAPPRLSAQVTMRIDSVPSGAEVICAGLVLGLTPLVLPSKAAPGTALVEIRLTGFATERLELPTDQNVEKTVRLHKVSHKRTADSPRILNEPPPIESPSVL